MLGELAKRAGEGTGKLVTQGAAAVASPFTNAIKGLADNFKPSNMIMTLARSGFGGLPDALLGIKDNIANAYSSTEEINTKESKATRETIDEGNTTLDSILKILEDSTGFLKDIRELLNYEKGLNKKQKLKSSAENFKKVEAMREKEDIAEAGEVNINAKSGLGIGGALLAGGIGGLADNMSLLILNAFKSIFAGLMALPFVTSIANVFHNLTTKAFVNIFSRITSFIKTGLFPAIGKMGMTLLTFVRNIPGTIIASMSKFPGAIVLLFTKIFPRALGASFSLGNILRLFGKLNLIGLAVMTIGQGLYAGIQEYTESGNIGDALWAVLDGMIKGLTFGLVDLKKIEDAFNNSIEFLKNLIGNKLDPLMNFIKDFTTKISNIFETIKTSMENAKATIDLKVNEMKDIVRDNIINPITDIFNKITGAFTSTINNIKNGVASMLNTWAAGFESKTWLPGTAAIAEALRNQANKLIGEPESVSDASDIGLTQAEARAILANDNDNEIKLNLIDFSSKPITETNIRENIEGIITPSLTTELPPNSSQANPSIIQLNNDNSTNQSFAPSNRGPQNIPMSSTPNHISAWESSGSILAN